MDEEEDRLSSLPDCLILEIISRLPETKYAIRTGTLSKQWQHIWPQVPNLTFIIDYEKLFVGTQVTGVQSLIDFYSSVDKTLTQCCHLNLNKFKLDTGYDIQFESLVNKWIRYAVKCNVQELELLLKIPGYKGGFVLDSESFSINSCFSKLKLNDCQFNPRGTFRWKKLRSLSITYAELNEGLIQNILSGSPVLETFKLKCCYGFSRMDISSKSLKNLVLDRPGYEGRFMLDSDSLSINSCFTNLKLVDCQFNPSGTINWKKLRSLSITNEELNEGLIQNILSGSPVLETKNQYSRPEECLLKHLCLRVENMQFALLTYKPNMHVLTIYK